MLSTVVAVTIEEGGDWLNAYAQVSKRNVRKYADRYALTAVRFEDGSIFDPVLLDFGFSPWREYSA